MKLNKASISFRIGIAMWGDKQVFEALLDLFDRYPGATDDLAFFTSHTHPPLPVDLIVERAGILKARIAQTKKHGYGAGINILSTIGHHEENLPHSIGSDYPRMVSLEGALCRGVLCPNADKTYDYSTQVYTALALAEPDFIWIDDDVRLHGHAPIVAGCFCDTCLALFRQRSGVDYTRESLSKAFNDAQQREKLRVRAEWMEHNRATINRLFAHIEKTVHAVRPRMPLGFMTGDRFFEGYDFAKWAETLTGPDGIEVLWRPGGGFYDDVMLAGMTMKSHDIGRQVSVLPDSVVCIQSEIENFPYQTLKKGRVLTSLEAASHIASGCTGAAFNILAMNPVFDQTAPFKEHEPFVEKMAASRPFYDLLVSTVGRSAPQGLYTGWTKNSFLASNIAGDWLTGNIWEDIAAPGREMFELGLPAAYRPDAAQVTMLSGDSVMALNDGEIRQILSSGVYMDAKALGRLNERGYGKLTGFRSIDFICEDSIERYVDHPMNAGILGALRDCRQSFPGWMKPAAVLEKTNDDAQTVSEIIDYADDVMAACGSGVFENELGGRVFVGGYFLWRFIQDLPKVTQLKALMRWLSRDSIPAYVSSFHRANLWARDIGADAPAVILINPNIEPAEGLRVAIRTPRDAVNVFDMQCRKTTLGSTQSDGHYRLFELPAVGPWEMRLVV